MINLPASFQLNDNFAKVTCERSWKWNTLENPLEDYDIWYVWSGEGSLTLNGVTHSISKGSCFLLRAGDRTLAGHNALKPLIVTYLHFSMNTELPWIPKPYRVVQDTFLFETYLNHYVEIMIAKGFNYELESKLLVVLMLIQLRKEEDLEVSFMAVKRDPLSAVINGIAHLVRQSPGAGHTLQSLAERAQLSPRYFSLKFKKVMGFTVESFLIRTRMERAEHLLSYNGMNVSEVAEALGYKDLSFFSRQFKQIRGKRPSVTGKNN